MTEDENAGQSGPAENVEPEAAQPTPPAPTPTAAKSGGLAARWRGSRPLRIVTAVVAAIVIGLVGFGAGLGASDHGGHHHGGHHMSAYRWMPGDRERMHRFDHESGPGQPPSASVQPTTTPAPSPAPTH
ncbi:hypothetical protein [Nocardia sp. NPDC051570]|uniref:hypothetical protein n=1 Tax=Nocardia sp. NPDC051570 TaxID=3364324 RepID=UPI0037ABF194